MDKEMMRKWSLELRIWCADQLNSLLHSHEPLDADDDLIQYLESMPNQNDCADYLRDLLGTSNAEVEAFLREFTIRIPQDAANQNKKATQSVPAESNFSEIAYMKPGQESLVYVPSKQSEKQSRNAQKGGGSSRSTTAAPNPQDSKGRGKNTTTGGSGSKKGTPVDIKDFHIVGVMPVQHPCKCLGQRHSVIVNCLNCGRIICEQEGPGPCSTCGFEIFSEKAQQKIVRQIKKGKGLQGEKLISAEEMERALKEAEAHKNKLLQYDKTSAQRTKVIDDEMDYFQSQSNSWLDDKERAKLRKREEEIREAEETKSRTLNISLDLAGRRVVAEPDYAVEELKKLYSLDLESMKGSKQNSRNEKPLGTGYYANSDVEFTPKYLPTKKPPLGTLPNLTIDETKMKKKLRNSSRVQHSFDGDEEVDNTDSGLALSMWQPWASLLVHGIKIVEGRTWPISHRGRLWIAAAAKKLEEADMQRVIEEHCPHLTPEQKQKMLPKYYPTSCIVGCVDIVDCLTQEEYRKKIPAESRQSDSPYVYICENPQKLAVPIPVSGQHKLWSLKTTDHALARSRLITAAE